jgi:acetyl-CoA acetyltransferase
VRQSFSCVAAVGGIGMTELSKSSGRTVLELALEACRSALDDAGLSPDRVGAVLSYHFNDSVQVNKVAEALGVPSGIWTNEILGGGTQSASLLGDAAMLVDAGIADVVVVFRALNGRSGTRMGQIQGDMGLSDDRQFTEPYGMLGPVHTFALSTRRWMHDAGITEEDQMAVVLQSRALARDNPRALLRDGLDATGYHSSPMVASPLRRVDCCLETDGAVALVVARAGLLDAVRPGSPRIHTAVRGGGPGATSLERSLSVSDIYSRYLPAKLYEAAGITASNIDLAMIYDAYSPIVLQQLEDWGLAPRGESGAMIRSGDTLPSGRLPINPHGGLLSEGYVHGFNNVAEAVRQLRGDAASHQVHDAEIALCTGFGGSYGSALVLTRG